MNFDEAIAAHSAWKIKLGAYLRHPDGSLQAASVASDDRCTLGQWLHGEGSKFRSLAEYRTLQTAHSKFHECAADVVRKADAGQSVTDEVAFGARSEFGLASSAVVNSIGALRKKVHAA